VLGLLVERRNNPDPEVQEAVERLIKAIKLQAARKRIVGLIKESGVDDDPEAILKKYSSPREEDRMEALTSLTLRHTPACVPIVKEFLEDPSEKVVDAAIGELRLVVKGKDQDIALRILKALGRTSPEEERMFDRINALLSFGDFRHEDQVKALKNIQNSKTRQLVFARMILVPEESFVFAFASMFDDKDRLVRWFCPRGIDKVIRDVLEKERREMFGFGKPDMKRLSKLLTPHLDSNDPVTVRVVANAIGRTGVPESTDKLIELLENEDIVTVRHAVISLGFIKAKKAAPALIGILKKGRYEALPECADALARIADPASFAPLLELLKKKNVPFKVSQASELEDARPSANSARGQTDGESCRGTGYRRGWWNRHPA
jgi:HEAT repeat protein